METEIVDIGWSKGLETGVDVLDAQHRKYLELVSNYLHKAAGSTEDSANLFELAETLDFLRQYAAEHFTAEEAVMERVNFPDYELHKQEHLFFLKHVDELYQEMLVNGYGEKLALEVHFYIAEWFIEHIQLSDVKLVEFLNQESNEDQSIKTFLANMYNSFFR
jgi:hemerythrin